MSATILGTAVYDDGVLFDQPSHLEMRIDGTAEIDDDNCPDAEDGRFVAYYTGDLVPTEDEGTANFSGTIYPESPNLFTPGGCPIQELSDPHVGAVSFTAWTANAWTSTPGAFIGRGGLMFQVLADVDQSTLEQGAFDDLWVTLVFEPAP